MPDLQLFMTDKDEGRLADFILTHSCTLVPDLKYQKPIYQEISSHDSYLEVRKKTRLFYIVAKGLIESSPEMRPVIKDGEIFFYISPRSGGPTIQLLMSGIFQDGVRNSIRPGFLSYYPTYWSSATGAKLKPPREFISVFGELKRYVECSFRAIRPGNNNLWIGLDAQRELYAGAELVGYESQHEVINALLLRGEGQQH